MSRIMAHSGKRAMPRVLSKPDEADPSTARRIVVIRVTGGCVRDTSALPDRAALERVAIVTQIGNTLGIERRPEAALRDLELCLRPMLASQAESRAFREASHRRGPYKRKAVVEPIGFDGSPCFGNEQAKDSRMMPAMGQNPKNSR